MTGSDRSPSRTRRTADYATMRAANRESPAPVPTLPVAAVWDHVETGS